MPWVQTRSPALLRDLKADLVAAGCLVREVDRTRLLVVVPGADPGQALVEIGFFLEAWTARHAPGGAAVDGGR